MSRDEVLFITLVVSGVLVLFLGDPVITGMPVFAVDVQPATAVPLLVLTIILLLLFIIILLVVKRNKQADLQLKSLEAYIMDNYGKYPEEALKFKIMEQGWSSKVVDKLFDRVKSYKK